jgi:integrase
MASIHKREDRDDWYVSLRDAEEVQHLLSLHIPHSPADPAEREANENKARAKAQQMENAARAKGRGPVPPTQDYLENFADTRSNDPETKRRDRNIIGRFLPLLSGQERDPLTIVLSTHIEAYRDMRVKEIEASTVNSELSLLNVAFEDALNMGFVVKNPVNLAKIKLQETSSVIALEKWQIQALLLATDILDWRTSIYIGFYTATQLVDASYRLWADVVTDPLGRPCLSFPGSERKPNKLVLLHPALVEHLKSLPRVNEWICPHIADLERWTADNHFAQIAEKAQLPGMTFRCLRRTHAEFLGLPIKRFDTAKPEALLALPDIRVPCLPCQNPAK